MVPTSTIGSHRVFLTCPEGRRTEVRIGPFVTSQMLNSRVFIMPINQASAAPVGDQLQKAGVSRD